MLTEWPGGDYPRVQRGSAGAITLDQNDGLLYARQHAYTAIVKQSTQKLCDAVVPRALYAPTELGGLQRFVNGADFGGISKSLLSSLSRESAALSSQAALDPAMGTRVRVNDQHIVYADERYVTRRALSPAEDAEDEVRFDVGSPVLEFSGPLVRARNGIYHVNFDRKQCERIFEGGFMSLSAAEHQAVLTTHDASAVLLDTTTSDVKWSQQLPRGSYSRWTRVSMLDEHTAAFANRELVSVLDFRQQRPAQSLLLLDHHDDTVSGLCTMGPDIFALTSSELVWLSGQRPVLALELPTESNDASVALTVTAHAERNEVLATVSSQVVPSVHAAVLSADNGVPVALCDFATVPTWPTLRAQSHAARFWDDEAEIFSAGASGGLYAQRVKLCRGNVVDDIIDVPLADLCEPDLQRDPARPRASTDYVLRTAANDARVDDLRHLYEQMYEQEPKPEDDARAEDFGEVPDPLNWPEPLMSVGQRIWIDPLKEKAQHTRVSDEALRRREHALRELAQRMKQAPKHNNETTGIELDLGPDLQPYYDWYDDPVTPAPFEMNKDEYKSGPRSSQAPSSPSSSHLGSQSPRTQPISQTQPSADVFSAPQIRATSRTAYAPVAAAAVRLPPMSQPLPSLASSQPPKLSQSQRRVKKVKKRNRAF